MRGSPQEPRRAPLSPLSLVKRAGVGFTVLMLGLLCFRVDLLWNGRSWRGLRRGEGLWTENVGQSACLDYVCVVRVLGCEGLQIFSA